MAGAAPSIGVLGDLYAIRPIWLKSRQNGYFCMAGAAPSIGFCGDLFSK